MAQHPVVGVPPRQRRPAAGADGGDLRAARRLAGTAGVAAGRAGARGVDVAAGVGEWTAAETAQRAFGDADAVSVGDYHIPKMVGWTLLGRPVDDAGMLELLEPMRPHRQRVVRLLEASGLAREPRRGPRLPVQQIHSL
ncbi:hypothetical protein I549_0817 [Mycobacterium avium subsp. avium 2285 (R)]|nr:hypothetical protein I549_0817 [Mycobacterium avium subsp. avium 2285 (R)]